jgi:hypothetical protein
MSERKGPAPSEHISTAVLMLYLDGELGEEEAGAEAMTEAMVTRHLHECWSCRERLEWMNRGVFTFLDYYRNVLVEALPEAEARPGVLAALREEALRPAETHPLRALWRRAARAAADISVPAWVTTAASLLLFIALPYLSVVQPARLTAGEFLARICKRPATHVNVRQAAAYRRVRIRRGTQVFERTLQHPHTRSAPATPPDRELLEALKIARVDWNDPLNPADFAAWHRSVEHPRDVIRDSPASITLETTLTGDSQLRAVSFTVNREDWRPLSHHIEFRGQPAIDVNELPLEPSEPVAAHRSSPRVALPEAGPKQDTSKPTTEQLDDAEVRLREVLHDLHADQYAAPVIRRGTGEIALLAFAPSSAQGAEIGEAVRDIPFVSQRIVTPASAGFSQQSAAPAQAAQEGGPMAAQEGGPPAAHTARAPLAESLRRYCGGLNQANAYLAALAESHSEALMAASALRSLADRYSEADWSLLSPELRARLGRLVDDYVTRLRRSARLYDALASPVLDAMLRETGTRKSTHKEAAGPHLSWREEPAAMAEQVQRMQSFLTQLFAEVPAERPGGPRPASELLTGCDRSRMDLERLLDATAGAAPPPE